jgi:hypothetical protein
MEFLLVNVSEFESGSAEFINEPKCGIGEHNSYYRL